MMYSFLHSIYCTNNCFIYLHAKHVHLCLIRARLHVQFASRDAPDAP